MSPSALLTFAKFSVRRFFIVAESLLLAACASPSPHATIQDYPTVSQTAPAAAATVPLPGVWGSIRLPPEPEAEPPGEDSVYFALGSAELDAMEAQRLKRVASELSHDRTKKAILVGFTDHLGSREYSVALATKRIKVITDTLIALGAKPKQLNRLIRGYDTLSARRCNTEACRQALRRVDITLVEAGAG